VKLIVGLGNPGPRYQNTRHNVGHWLIDQVARTRSEIATPASRDSRLYKTTVFMNESGKELKKLVTRYSLPTTNLLVVHDDFDLPPGRWKLQFNRSAAGHKGVQNIINELGTQAFWRLRIGIGKPFDSAQGDQFVIEKPTKEERKEIERAIEESIPRVLEWARLSANPNIKNKNAK